MTTKFSGNLRPAATVMGAMDGVGGAVRTKGYIESVSRSAHRLLSLRFNEYMHAVAKSNPKAYHHVYEWDMTGTPGAQLWKNELKGRGSQRTKTFSFTPSKTKVPAPPVGPGPTGKQVQSEHIFAAKAPIMEYGIPVKITGDILFIYLGERSESGEEYTFTSNPVIIDKPGGPVMGNFTNAWLGWHGLLASQVLEKEFFPRYENHVEGVMTKAGSLARSQRIGTRAKTKSFKIDFDASSARAKQEMLIKNRMMESWAANFEDDFGGTFGV